MCWITYKTPEKKVAESDIRVYKFLMERNKKFYAPYRPFQYTIGKNFISYLEEAESSYDRYSEIKRHEIHVGLHSYSENCICWVKDVTVDIYDEEGIKGRDYWSYSFRNMYDEFGDIYIVEAVIPKGSEYYLNEFGEYVSNFLRIEKPIISVGELTAKRYNEKGTFKEFFLEGSK